MASDVLTAQLGTTQAGRVNAHQLLVGIAIAFIALFVVSPLGMILAEAVSLGIHAYVASLTDPDVRAALWLTLGIAVLTVPLNTAFGLVALWCLARFRGRSTIIALIELPLSVSPVVAGLLLVLLFSRSGLLGGFLEAHGIRIIFAVPGMILATLFVTFPHVARALIPLAEVQGSEEEQAAITLGASGGTPFFA